MQAKENSPTMHAYIINMDSAVDRWRSAQANFEPCGIGFERLPAVHGRALRLPIPEFDEAAYRKRHGKHPNLGQVGCYLSHLRCLRTFLASPYDYGIILEDDIQIDPRLDLKGLLERAIALGDHWDILRLSGFHHGHPRPFAGLGSRHSLAVNMTRLCGSAAYMVHRQAAAVLLERLTPMTVPIDHALDREWVYGLRAASIDPLPIDQERHAFVSQIPAANREKLPVWSRYWTVFPYRFHNELHRLVYRHRQWYRAKANRPGERCEPLEKAIA
jgi:glycosyl transferase family 25